MKTLSKPFSSDFFSPRAIISSPSNFSFRSPSKFTQNKLNQSIEHLQEKMSQAKAKLHFTENNERSQSIHEFEFIHTNEKVKKIELDNRNFKSQIEDLKHEIKTQKFSDNRTYLNTQGSYEKNNSSRVLSSEIEDLTKQLEMKNLENLFNEKKFVSNFSKIQHAYNLSTEKIAKFQKLVKLYEKKFSGFEKRKKQLKETVKLKEMRINDLERENKELQAKVSSKDIFSSMEVNYGQVITLQNQNSDLKAQLQILEKELNFYKDRLNDVGGSKEVNINNKKNVKFVNGNEKELIEQLSLMILSKPGTRKKREETRGSLKEQFGEKFADTLENYFKKLDNSELRNRKTSLNLISNIQREILLSEELKMVLQLVFKTAEEFSGISELSDLSEDKFEEIRNRFINYKGNHNLRYINLLQEINERQFELNNIQKECSFDNDDFDEYAILLKNNDLIKTKLESLQFQNSQLKNDLNCFENNKITRNSMKTREKNLDEGDVIEKNGLYLMMVSQASIIENFLNERVL